MRSGPEGGKSLLPDPLLEDAGISSRQQRKSPTQIISTSLNRQSGLARESSTESYMLEHSNKAVGKQEHICPTCGKKFSRKFNQERHISSSHGDGVVCQICKKSLSRSDKLKEHIKVHTAAAIPLRSTSESGIKITWSESTHAKRVTRGKAQPIPGHEEEYDKIVALASSYPAKYRYEGGKMTRGPLALAQDPVQGNKEAFDKQGRLRDRYGFLEKRIPVREDNPKMPTPNRPLGLRARYQLKVRSVIPSLPVDPLGSSTEAHQSHPPPFVKVSDTRCHGWKPPKRWPKDFPKHPMHISGDAPKCEICHNCSNPTKCLSCDSCRCIIEIRKVVDLKVVDDGAKGKGIMAFARKNDSDDVKAHRKPLCRKGDVIGELPGDVIGELPGDVKNKEPGPDWSFEITRDDLSPKLRRIGVIYCRDISNDWGKINHTCQNANVEFEEKTVSFRRRLIAVAARDIYSGDWLLTDYGRGFWKGREEDCLCGSEKCISLGLKLGITYGGNSRRPLERMQREVGSDVANTIEEHSKQSAKRLRQARKEPSNRPSKRRALDQD